MGTLKENTEYSCERLAQLRIAPFIKKYPNTKITVSKVIPKAIDNEICLPVVVVATLEDNEPYALLDLFVNLKFQFPHIDTMPQLQEAIVPIVKRHTEKVVLSAIYKYGLYEEVYKAVTTRMLLQYYHNPMHTEIFLDIDSMYLEKLKNAPKDNGVGSIVDRALGLETLLNFLSVNTLENMLRHKGFKFEDIEYDRNEILDEMRTLDVLSEILKNNFAFQKINSAHIHTLFIIDQFFVKKEEVIQLFIEEILQIKDLEQVYKLKIFIEYVKRYYPDQPGYYYYASCDEDAKMKLNEATLKFFDEFKIQYDLKSYLRFISYHFDRKYDQITE